MLKDEPDGGSRCIKLTCFNAAQSFESRAVQLAKGATDLLQCLRSLYMARNGTSISAMLLLVHARSGY